MDEAGRHRPVDKVFVGGIAAETTRKEVKDYFEEKFEGCKVKNVRTIISIELLRMF